MPHAKRDGIYPKAQRCHCWLVRDLAGLDRGFRKMVLKYRILWNEKIEEMGTSLWLDYPKPQVRSHIGLD